MAPLYRPLHVQRRERAGAFPLGSAALPPLGTDGSELRELRKKSGRGLPHSMTLRDRRGALEWCASSWSAPALWRFSPRKRSIAPPRNGWFGIARAPEEKRQGTTALHDASRSSRRVGLMRQLLECACPLALFPLGTGAPELRTLRRESGRALPSSTACRPSTNQQIFVKKSSLLFLSRAGNLFVLVRGVA
jgi:hypothetical protein